jgi:signal peptidase II
MTPRRLALTVAAGVIVLDQATKQLMLSLLEDGPIELIPGVLQLAIIKNPGMAFGLLRGAGSVVALVAIAAAITIFLATRTLRKTLDAIALGLILGGAIGNLLDRIFRGDGFLDGEVIDWFDLSFFPAFNVADSAITIGAVLALWSALQTEAKASSSPTN